MFFRKLLFERYLEKGETLYHTVHRHWVAFYMQAIKIAIFGYLIPLCYLLFVVGFNSVLSWIGYGWMIIAAGYSIYAFLDWYLDAWLVTDISIIDTAWDGFFKQRSSRVDYESIESVDFEIKGIRQSLLNFGKITLIRSSNIHVTMDHVHKPQRASAWITRIQGEVSANKNTQNSESLKGLLADIIQDHIKVNSQ